jgi:superfamily II DNA or RNA helicase
VFRTYKVNESYMIKFRDYQQSIIDKGTDILRQSRFLYLAMEVRTGKTLTSLGIIDRVGADNVLFVTKKKAIGSIESDYKMLKPSYNLHVINYESLHKIPRVRWDAVVCDEAHSMGAFPKPNKRAKTIKDIINNHSPLVVLLSGTPTPESYSQMYHQVYGIPGNPFNEFTNFYKFARKHVFVKARMINGYSVNDYSGGNKSIIQAMQPYTISYTQKQAGFVVDTKETVLSVKMSDSTYDLVKRLRKDLVIDGEEETILAETSVKLMNKLHQLYSGTVKFESGNSMVIDTSKAEFIRDKFKSKKIGIFYKFRAELDALKQVFADNLCTDLDTFNSTDKHIALQIVSGREGISLRKADALVYYNIDFSATSYWQSRDRMTTKDRLKNDIYWVFAEKGIESQIYKMVTKKKDYTLYHFKKDFVL